MLNETPIDGGPIAYAEGTTQVNGDGIPISYTVGEGDVFEFVAKRFDLGTAYLWSINAVRRDGKGLYIGDVINLDPTTVTSVGNENGVAYSHLDRLSDPHLPQK
jgi:LysM repeat protein